MNSVLDKLDLASEGVTLSRTAEELILRIPIEVLLQLVMARLVTYKQAAVMLAMSEAKVKKMAQRDQVFKIIKIDTSARLLVSEIQAYVDQRISAAAAVAPRKNGRSGGRKPPARVARA